MQRVVALGHVHDVLAMQGIVGGVGSTEIESGHPAMPDGQIVEFFRERRITSFPNDINAGNMPSLP